MFPISASKWLLSSHTPIPCRAHQPHLLPFFWDKPTEFQSRVMLHPPMSAPLHSVPSAWAPHMQRALSQTQHPGEAEAVHSTGAGPAICFLPALGLWEHRSPPQTWGGCFSRAGPWRYPTKGRKHGVEPGVARSIPEDQLVHLASYLSGLWFPSL